MGNDDFRRVKIWPPEAVEKIIVEYRRRRAADWRAVRLTDAQKYAVGLAQEPPAEAECRIILPRK